MDLETRSAHELLYRGMYLRKLADGAKDAAKVVQTLHACCQKTIEEGIFSSNESLDDIATSDLPLLLAFAYSAESIFTLDTAGSQENRLNSLADVEVCKIPTLENRNVSK